MNGHDHGVFSQQSQKRPGTSRTYTMDDSDEEGMNLTDSGEDLTTIRRPKTAKRTFLTQSRNNKKHTSKPKTKTTPNSLSGRPPWVQPSTHGATPTSDMTVTHINQTYGKVRARDMAAMFNEGQTSGDWLKNHSIEHFNLTLKNLLSKGHIIRSKTNNQKIEGAPKELQFEASVVNEFEYKLYESIEMYHNRIRWLLKGSKKTFGMIKGNKVALVVDSSDSNCGFGRISHFKESLMELIDEQLHNREMLYLMSFGTNVDTLWHTPRYTNIRILDEARYWVNSLSGTGGCNLLAAIKKVLSVKDIDSIVLVMGSCPDQSAEILTEYMEQLIVGRQVPLHCVAFDCNNHLTNKKKKHSAKLTLRTLADISGGRYHVYASGSEEQIYTGTDITMLLREIRIAQDVINKIQEMRQGMMGDALVSILNEISLEVQKLPQSRFLPRPPNHTGPLKLEEQTFLPKTSEEWLQQNGLKGKRLSLYQVLAPNAFSQIEEFIPVIRKSVRSQTHEKAMTQFEWYDGSIKNVHVDPALLFDYQKQLGATVKLYEKRVDWLSKGSRRLFGTLTEKRIVILIDLSLSNTNYLVHIQHSLRLLLQEQLLNKESFNLIGFGSTARAWRPYMHEPTEQNVQMAWKWVLGLECSGSRNFLSALRLALENEEDRKRDIAVDGVYLFTSGIPDQLPDVICSFMEEATIGQDTRLHSILFNVDDYDSNGAIPSRYANITQTAECLRTLAHVTSGRFHWFRETGIIESDDIKSILSEMDKAVNYSQKCAMLVDSVKKRSPKYQAELTNGVADDQAKMLPMRPSSAKKKALPAPKHTELSLARLQITENKDREDVKPLPRSRPTSAKKDPIKLDSNRIASEREKPKRPFSAGKAKPAKQVFYTEFKNEVGTVFKQYPDNFSKKKSLRKPINHPSIPDREEVKTTKEWLKMYGLSKLRLDLNKLVSGPECSHAKHHIGTLNKAVSAKYCTIFPSVNIKGTVRHLQMQAHELQDYENQLELVLRRYLRRLQWLLGASRRTFGAVVEKKVIVLVDTSGSMVSHMEELKRELVALIWDQFQRENISFNIIRFSGDIEPWRNSLVEPTEINCHDAVRWVSTFVPAGNTCTLEALLHAFQDEDIQAIYLLTDGKPDSSTTRVLREVAQVNTMRMVKVHTISFNCEDETANIFLRQLAAMCRSRYHRCYAGMDGDLMAHKLLNEGLRNLDHPVLPTFDSDDLRQVVSEIEQARHFLAQSQSFRQLFGTTTKPHEKNKSSRLMPANHIQPVTSAATS